MNEREREIIQRMCDYDMNMAEVARAMYMHRNTLVYHAEKMREKYGLDPRRFYDLCVLKQMADAEKEEGQASGQAGNLPL